MELQQELSKLSVKVSENLSEDLTSIMVDAEQRDIPPFMNFFREEQQEYIKCLPEGIWYHPVIIQFCLSLALKSALVYDIQFDEKLGVTYLPFQAHVELVIVKTREWFQQKLYKWT